MTTQAYQVVKNHAYKISGWKILSRLILSQVPHIGGINGDVQSDLSNLALKNGEQNEYFHSIILKVQ